MEQYADDSYRLIPVQADRWICLLCGATEIVVGGSAEADVFALSHAREAHKLEPEPEREQEREVVSLTGPNGTAYSVNRRRLGGKVLRTVHLASCHHHQLAAGFFESEQTIRELLAGQHRGAGDPVKMCSVCLPEGLPPEQA